jgi:hypothetical protein
LKERKNYDDDGNIEKIHNKVRGGVLKNAKRAKN